MPVLSCLRAPAVTGARTALAQLKHVIKQNAPVRSMSDSMQVKASNYQTARLRDNFVYFTFIGVVPLALFSVYMNIFRGPAELREIPEDYVPEPHEYHKGPVQRFMAKYLITPPEKYYERSIYYVYALEEKRRTKVLLKKYEQLAKQRQDEKGWFYVPMLPEFKDTHAMSTSNTHPSLSMEYSNSIEK